MKAGINLKKLIKELTHVKVRGTKDVEVTGLTANSKAVAPGNIFVAKRGGAQYIPDAVAAGAVAIVTDLYNPFFEQVTQIVTSDMEDVEVQLAAQFFDAPDKKLCLIGITGTNGKTTCSYLIKHLFDQLGQAAGLIGTIETFTGKSYFPSTHTTPDLLTNFKYFHEMVASGCKAAVMEVSSHALEQGRVKGLEYEAAVFTNLTLDHLDYHKTMESYAAAKAKLFVQAKIAVVNVDDPAHELMVGKTTITYGIDRAADLQARDIELTAHGISFTIKGVPFRTHLIGRFNVYNCLAAIGVCQTRGFSLEEIARHLSTFTKVPGRLERVPNQKGLNVFVDYAHTDDALRNVLTTLRELKKGRLITVFGCGGNRDMTKRPKMGEVVANLSDFSVVTSDNPRNEEPLSIIEQILPGFKSTQEFVVEPDRASAIARAIKMANRDDIVLIAGKGHENYQIFAHRTIHFDDREAAVDAIANS